MPSADFCPAVRRPFDHLSRRSDAEQISWGKLNRLPCTAAESRFAPLMDMDFAVSCPLVRHWRLVSGFCPSTRTFVPCFLQTPPRGGSPCIITRPYLHQVGQRTFTSKLLSMPSTQRRFAKRTAVEGPLSTRSSVRYRGHSTRRASLQFPSAFHRLLHRDLVGVLDVA